MQEHTRFSIIAAEFESMQKEFEQTNDPALRRALLIELRAKLELIQKMAASLGDNLPQPEN